MEELESESSESINKLDSDRNAQQRAKRHRSESPTANKRPRPVPPLQSILAQTLLTSNLSPRQVESSTEMQSELQLPRPSSPPNTLAKLLTQSPASTLGSSRSCSFDMESNNAESNASKPEETGSINNQMVSFLIFTDWLF